MPAPTTISAMPEIPATPSPLTTQILLCHPLARGTCMLSSVVMSPLTLATSLPMERLAQHHAIKQEDSSQVKSSTEDSSAEGTYGSAESTYGGCPRLHGTFPW